MPINPLALKSLEWAAKTLFGYFHIRDYFSLRLTMRSGKTHRHIYDRYADCGEEEFWKDLLYESAEEVTARSPLQDGHVVTLQGFQVTDWLPLLPGTWWSTRAKTLRRSVELSGKQTELYLPGEIPVVAWDPGAKLAMVTGGYGSFRLKATSSVKTAKGEYSLFCATSSGDSWKGIPLLVCPELADRFRNHLNNSTEGLIVQELTGRLSSLPCKLKERLPSSVTTTPAGSALISALDSPELVLVVDSPLLAKCASTIQEARAVAWASYEVETQRYYIDQLKGYDSGVIPGFTYHIFDTRSRKEYDWARTFVRGYAAMNGASKVIGDYDEVQPWEVRISPLPEVMHKRSPQPLPPQPREFSKAYAPWEPPPDEKKLNIDDREQIKKLLKRMTKVDPEQSRRYRQSTMEDNVTYAAERVTLNVEYPLGAMVSGKPDPGMVNSLAGILERWSSGVAYASFKKTTDYWYLNRAPGHYASE